MTLVLECMSAHRSIRKFTDRPVDAELLASLITAAQCTSTSHHVQAYTIIQVTDPGSRQKIADMAGPQPWVAEAPIFLVFCADLNRLVSACRHHKVNPETGWAEQLLVATVDTALVAQSVMLGAESVGLGGVFIGGIRNDPELVCDLLHIPEHAFPVFGMCLGYPDDDPAPKPRLPLNLVFHQDRFPETVSDREMTAYDLAIQAYYEKRAPKLRDRTWTRQMADFTGQVIRPHMKPFLRKKGFPIN
ncbi:MAG: oxygen-insensitive NADPH nitroreductase [Desulfotignum sp.]|nr:oxygen-insensitive NADPH nitroreductase [Desulfotignum sp.]